MTTRYNAVHNLSTLAGPGDARPTALDIIKDNSLENAWPDKTILVTGCSSGIGIDTVGALAATGAKIYACVRSISKGEQALHSILTAYPGYRVSLLELDLSSLASVRACAAAFLARESKLNILINNAGVMMIPTRQTSIDGHELQFASNHLGHFLLFQLLKPALLAAAAASSSSSPGFASRVVNVSSMGHRICPVQLTDLNLAEPGAYTPAKGYGNSKTANILMANEIERRYGTQGLHGWSLHPGGIETGLQVHSERILADMRKPEIIRVMKSTAQGAATSVLAAVDKELEGRGGRYLDDCTEAGLVGETEQGGGNGGGYESWIYDGEAARELWRRSCVMCGVQDD